MLILGAHCPMRAKGGRVQLRVGWGGRVAPRSQSNPTPRTMLSGRTLRSCAH
jgi:hypothetical protein